MKPTLDKSYSPCSEGYSCVTTRYRDRNFTGGSRLNFRVPEAWIIKNEGFNVVGKKERSMYLSLDVVVQ